MTLPNQPVSRWQTDFPAEEFVARREKLFDAIGDGAYALLQSAPAPRGYVVFRQTNEFFYCCGLETPQAYLLLNGAARTAALYLPERGRAQLGEGAPPGLEDADLVKSLTGVDAVCPREALAEHLAEARVVYTPHAPAELRAETRHDLLWANQMAARDPWDGQPAREQRLIALLRSRFPRVEVRDLTPILDELRSVKSPREVAVMRRAGRLCAQAVREAMCVTRPGVVEGQLGALANYIYAVNGAQGEGYRPIIAGGENIWHVHYFLNHCPLQDGDLVLMDVAPECRYYTSDIGRMWPVNGVYAPWQRELYGYIVAYHKVLLSALRPGVMPDQVMDEAAATMRPLWERWPFSKESHREGARRTLEFRGHLSHPVGMAVHDDGDYLRRPLLPGTVFAVDPQMWIPEEKLYIRVEDTVVVTATGIEILTAAAPLELDDVEALMRDEATTLPYLME
ncbi:MAG TPA: Xaa-Pro peptidase family protein [Anaerolineae bacterium]|nr:Xaa-Pro peptidase family protein [Anaerolineae bacterium]HQI84061.1 Xaa-Pro peptidase family protein [Anaerolineae bacterium]